MPARSCSPVGHRTTYSRSSWERHLNGKALPPATAIAEFAAAGGASPMPPALTDEREPARRPAPTGSGQNFSHGAGEVASARRARSPVPYVTASSLSPLARDIEVPPRDRCAARDRVR
ncbi:hypothetical protein OG728_34145 [Streptomyces microflavus]|uniref:hypothetical protein n=1 Tax=Streptomyces TaxID=1883 RepID=UPI000B91BC7D|nr:hypothetical protein [Streptomyces microflavus]OXY92185.1 hypothetical protein BEH93_36205 [Streptomyces sp. 2R]WSR95153.1 hypothetical protein OG728_34145 [Streptomyces microflavus]